MSYLRLPRDEYEVIVHACRYITLTEDFFPVFKYFLLESLVNERPDLSAKVSNLRRSELELLFQHLRQQRRHSRKRKD